MTTVIIAGSRDITDWAAVRRAINDAGLVFGDFETVIHGGARGVDSIADEICREMGYDVEVYEADWEGTEPTAAAGPIRNSEMAADADALVAVWDGESSGTSDMISKALDHNLEIIVKQV